MTQYLPPWSEDVIDGPTLALDWTALALQVSGSQDVYPVHHDPDFAKESGHDRPFFNTDWTSALLTRTVTDWAGTGGWMRHLDFQMRKMNALGDVVRGRARVRETNPAADGGTIVELDVWLENDSAGVTTIGSATVVFDGPRR